MTASSSGCTPLFFSADPRNTGTNVRLIHARFIAAYITATLHCISHTLTFNQLNMELRFEQLRNDANLKMHIRRRQNFDNNMQENCEQLHHTIWTKKANLP